MLTNLPFTGSFSVIQAFGDQPDLYKTLACDGIALRGHNGLDFATPSGTPVLAVQRGVVLAARTDPGGFGNFVLLGHDWGQSLYGHLEQINVQTGQQITGGQVIGTSGASGQTSTPQLHFGLRIAPFSLQDGWCGYSDPTPYLERLTKPRGPIIGAHMIGGVNRHLDTLHRWQPRLLLVLDPNPGEMRTLRQACPDTVIIGRIFAPDGEVDQRIRADPQAAAQWAHEKTLASMTPEVNYWQFANEVLQTEDTLAHLNEFEMTRMALAEAAGYKCAILAFSVGNPDLPEADRMRAWQCVYPALERAENNDHVVALHQYGKPDLWNPAADWYIFRLEHQVLRRLPFKKVQFAVTEYGIDGAIGGAAPQGWQGFTNAEDYSAQLLKNGRHLERFSGRVLGYAVFTLGNTSPWQSYDIADQVANLLADRSERGVWSQINMQATGITPGESDTTTDAGGTLATDEQNGGGEQGGGEQGGSEPPSLQIERRLSDWVAKYNMRIRTLDERPDKPTGDVIYVIKDIFTTCNGAFDPSDQPGSIPQWARDAYLNANFLEAGADHHLFAAVIGLDGAFVKNQEILYWSDGFDKLGDAEYQGYVREKTKESSGWSNTVIYGGSSFVPERGESGPWSWAPVGAAEVVCGGGLPAKHHISTFVVWQAVRPEENQPDHKDFDHNIFLPFISNARTLEPDGTELLTLLRHAIWQQLNPAYQPDSLLAAYARHHQLGMPVTPALEVAGYLVAGFAGGIVYAPVQDQENVKHIQW